MRRQSLGLAGLFLIALISLIATATEASAQVLRVQGDHFTLDGRPRFLVFISYFDGLRRIPDSLESTAVLDADLDYFVRKGVGGIRVLPNWRPTDEALMDCAGNLRATQLQKLKSLIDRAAVKGLVVDVSFTIETVKDAQGESCLALANYASALAAVASELRGRTNLLFDLQNEYPNWIPQTSHLMTVRDAVRTVDPSRILTISTAGGSPEPASVDTIKDIALDVVAYHDQRSTDSTWANDTDDLISRLRNRLAASPASRKPIYLQEPNRFPPCATYCDSSAVNYETAVRNAKAGGAAAWTFHNNPNKDLSSTIAFQDMLRAEEQKFLDNLAGSLTGAWGVGSERG